MKKIFVRLFLVFFVFLFVSVFVSCGNNEPTVNQDVAKILLSSSKDDTRVFYINVENGNLTLTANFANSEGVYVKTTEKVTWSSDFTEKEVEPNVVIAGNKYTVDINSIDKLDDYTITASYKPENKETITEKFTFSLYSQSELKNDLVYSYIRADALKGNIGENGIVNTFTIKEFDNQEMRIVDSSQRMIVGSDISYFVNGSSLVYITKKDATEFGFLSANVLSGNARIFDSMENGFVVVANQEEIIKLEINAGTKDKRVLTINAIVPENTLADTTTYDPVNAVGDGKIFNVAGDNVSDDGNTMEIEVYRKKYDGSDCIDTDGNALLNQYSSYGLWKDNSETMKLLSGYSVHLLHAGDYVVRSRITSVSGTLSGKWSENFIHIEPYTTLPDCYTENNLGNTPIINNSNWTEHFAGESPRVEKKSFDVSNALSGTRYVKLSYVKDNSETLADNITERYAIPSGQNLSNSINTAKKFAGTYTVNIWTDGVGGGYGAIYDESEILGTSYSVTRSFEIKGKKYSAIHVDVTGEAVYTVKNNITSLESTDTLYVAAFKDGVFIEGFTLAAGATHNIANNDYRAYSLRSYVFSSDNRISSDIQVINCPVPTLRVSGNISPVQQVRKIGITVTNSKNSLNEYRSLSYAWTDSEIQPTSWTSLGRNASYSLTKTTEGRQYLWVKTDPYNETAEPVINHASITLTIPTLTATASSYSGDDIQDARNQRKVRIYNPTYTGLNGGTYRRNMYIQKNWGGYVYYGAAEYVDLSHNWEGNCTYHVKLVAGDYENAKGETITTINVNLVKLPIVTVGHEWFGVFSWDHSVWINDVYPGATVQCSGFDGNKTLHSTGEHYYEAWPGDYGNVTTMQWKIGYMDSDSYTFYAGQ